ncbi:hypothetical protein ACP70R_029805 [Stipagrostis hirtigluma subsp. patula]
MAPTEHVAGAATAAAPPPPHFVIVPVLARGHIIPLFDLARLLAARGARASVVTTPLHAARLRGVAGHAVELVELPFPPPGSGLPPDCQGIDMIADNSQILPFFLALRELAGPLDAYLRALERRPSCIVADWCCPWTAAVARSHGIPRLFFHGPSCFFSLCDLNATEHGLHDQIAAGDDREQHVVPGMPVAVKVTKGTADGFFNGPGFERLRDEAMEAMRTADGAVANTFMELEAQFVACYEAALGKPVWTVGPLSLANRDGEATASRCRGKMAAADETAIAALLAII